MKQKFLLGAVALAVVLLLGAPTAFANACLPGGCLLTNGSFETGDFTGWTQGGNLGFTQVSTGAAFGYTGAEDGLYYATMGPVGSDGTLSQSFADTVGARYCFSFWINAVGDDPSDFSAYFDGTQVYGATDPNTGGAWTHITVEVTGTGSDTIQFSFRDDPGWIALDNVSVCPGSCSSVPESSNLAMLLGFGVFNLAAVLGVRRKLI